jgi:hypothetical protein
VQILPANVLAAYLIHMEISTCSMAQNLPANLHVAKFADKCHNKMEHAELSRVLSRQYRHLPANAFIAHLIHVETLTTIEILAFQFFDSKNLYF